MAGNVPDASGHVGRELPPSNTTTNTAITSDVSNSRVIHVRESLNSAGVLQKTNGKLDTQMPFTSASPCKAETKMEREPWAGIGSCVSNMETGTSVLKALSSKQESSALQEEILTPVLPTLPDDEDDSSGHCSHPLATLPEEDSAPLNAPPALPTSPIPEMLSQATLVLRPPSPDVTDGETTARTCSIKEDGDGTVVYRKVSQSEHQDRVVTITSKVRRTPSNAQEEMRDTVVETTFRSPGGSAVKERDVIRSRRKITPRGSNYYQRTTQHTRRVKDKGGSDYVEQDVTVYNDNTSASDGRSWGNKTVTKVTLDNPQGELPSMLEDLPELPPQLEAPPPKTGQSQGQGQSQGRMDLSKASSGYGSVSGSEEEDKDLSPTPDGRLQNLVGAPEVVSTLKDLTLTEAQEAVLQCALVGHPAPEVTWYRGEEPLPADPQRLIVAFDPQTGLATLTFSKVALGDAGKYMCVGSNQFGQASTRCTVLVTPAKPVAAAHLEPVFVRPLTDVTVTAEQAVTLSCEVTSAEAVTWQKDGAELRSPWDGRQAAWDGRVATLQVREVQPEDSGIYACLARGFGSASGSLTQARTSCRLEVTASSKEVRLAPTFLTKLRDATLTLGDPLTLECEVVGSPEPAVRWTRDGSPLPDGLSYSARYDGRVAALRVEELGVRDGGVYACVAENCAGRASVDARVLVEERTLPPSFLSQLQDVTVEAGKSVSLRCEVTGSPPPSATWRRNGLLVADTPDFLQTLAHGVARLEIFGVKARHQGRYECLLQNEAGAALSACRLTVNEPLSSAGVGTDVHVQRKTEAVGDEQHQHQSQQQQQHEQAEPRQEELSPGPPVTRRRAFKKLSEPHPADIISAVLAAKERKSGLLLQRTQSLSPGTHPPFPSHPLLQAAASSPPSSSSFSSSPSAPAEPLRSFSAQQQPQLPWLQPRTLESKEEEEEGKGGGDLVGGEVGERYSVQWTDGQGKVTQEKDLHPQQWNSSLASAATSGDVNTSVDVAPAGCYSTSTSSSSSSSSTFTTNVAGPRSLTSLREGESWTSAQDMPPAAATLFPQRPAANPQQACEGESSSSVRKFSAPWAALRASPTPERKFSEPPRAGFPAAVVGTASSSPLSAVSSTSSISPRSVVSQLRTQFGQMEASVNGRPDRDGAAGLKRAQSMPLRQERPSVAKRGPSQLAAETQPATMSSYDHINDEEELHKMMNATDSFEERKKIRSRLREIRDKQREEMEARRQQREKETEDLVRKKFELAEEEKRRKLQSYGQQAPTHQRQSEYQAASDRLVVDKHRVAEEEKQKKLQAYTTIAKKEHSDNGKTTSSTTITTTQGPDGSTTVTKKTETTTTVKQTSGFGGVQYGSPAPKSAADLNTRHLKEQLGVLSGPDSSGSISVRTESWSSHGGPAHKAQKTESWGAKPQGAKGAMAAFKQMDAANPAPKANKPTMARSPSAIKQVLLDWCKAMTREYENVEVTNFSSSWNDGMAFCALIHHFFPDAFDFKQLDPKNRRHNFQLAFDTAEKVADIAPLLDVEDMVKMKNPDWKCVFTYVQSIYRHLRDHDKNKAKAGEAEA